MTDLEILDLLKGEFTLDIPNFEKWNPPMIDKKTGEPYPIQMRDHVRMSVHFLDDPKMHGLGDIATILWLKLVLQRARHGTPLSHCTTKYCADLIQQRASRVPKWMVKLANRRLIIFLNKERNKEIKKEEEGISPVSPAWDRFNETQVVILKGQFGVEFLNQHLTDAVACWDTYDPYRQSQTPLIKTVQSYLKRARDNPTESPKKRRTLMEMAEAGEVDA